MHVNFAFFCLFLSEFRFPLYVIYIDNLFSFTFSTFQEGHLYKDNTSDIINDNKLQYL